MDVIGQENLNSLRGIGYANLELWSQRLLNECGAVDNVIDALTALGVEHRLPLEAERRRWLG